MNWKKDMSVNNVNYQRELDRILADLSDRPRLLLHSCCAPCSSYCLVYLRKYFDITCLYYNPNITDEDEYNKRLAELVRLKDMLNSEPVSDDGKEVPSMITVIDGGFDPDSFIARVRENELEKCPEGGRRCEMCFSMRLNRTYDIACEGGYDYFTTTLTISPLKDAKLINMIGSGIAERNGEGPKWLFSDFKKNDGYKQSIELSKKYDLYRQNYCGCWLSRPDAAAGGAPFERG